MLLQRLHGLLFLLIGAVSIADGLRITQQARQGANFDAIGPDRYLMALGTLMLAAGAWHLLPRTSSQTERRTPEDGQGADALKSLLVTLGLLGTFALAVPLIGYSVACFLFLAAQFRLLGGWTSWRSLAAAALIALAFHVAFIRFADMPLPKGYFGI